MIEVRLVEVYQISMSMQSRFSIDVKETLAMNQSCPGTKFCFTFAGVDVVYLHMIFFAFRFVSNFFGQMTKP